MTVTEIIKAVRWCIDEESNNNSSMADVIDEKDDSYMDNIIKSQIPDALHWIAITATASSVLSSSTVVTETEEKTETDEKKDSTTTSTATIDTFDSERKIGIITMPDNVSVFNVNRVRANGWYKAVVPVEDTDDEALEMYDDSACGTVDRPIAAIMRVTPLQILIQPMPTGDSKNVTISYVGIPTGTTTESGSESVDIPEAFKSAFIHYLAFLLLSAYDDTKATQMYTIALQQLGATKTE